MLLNLSWLSGNFDDRGSMIYGYNIFQSLRGCISLLWHDLHMWISLQINFWWELHLPGLRSSYLKTNPAATLKDLLEKRQSAMSSCMVFPYVCPDLDLNVNIAWQYWLLCWGLFCQLRSTQWCQFEDYLCCVALLLSSISIACLQTATYQEPDWYPSLLFKAILNQMHKKKSNLKGNNAKKRNKTLRLSRKKQGKRTAKIFSRTSSAAGSAFPRIRFFCWRICIHRKMVQTLTEKTYMWALNATDRHKR